MDIFVKRFDSDEPALKFCDIDDEESMATFKQRVADLTGIDVYLIRLIDDGEWGSLLLENGTCDDISNNLVHMVVLPEDREWDQFFFFVRPLNGKRVLVEADFLETVASVKSRLLTDQENRVPDSQIGLIYKWNILSDEMSFDDETMDLTVGCTLDLFIREPDQCSLIFKNPSYKNFTLVADLSETTAQLMTRIHSQENVAIEDQLIMNLSGEKAGKIDQLDKTLAEQGIGNEQVLMLDTRSGAPYHLKIKISTEETIDFE